MKALVGVPLLGLLAKLPKAKEEWSLLMPDDPEYVDYSVGQGELNVIMPGDPGYVDCRVGGLEKLNLTMSGDPGYIDVTHGDEDYCYTIDKDPYLPFDNLTAGDP